MPYATRFPYYFIALRRQGFLQVQGVSTNFAEGEGMGFLQHIKTCRLDSFKEESIIT